MQYDKEIIYVLMEAGEDGLSAKKISRHVYNARNSLFEPIPFSKVHKAVLRYLHANSHNDTSIIKRIRKGLYCINKGAISSNQLLFDFKEYTVTTTKPSKDEQHLLLF